MHLPRVRTAGSEYDGVARKLLRRRRPSAAYIVILALSEYRFACIDPSTFSCRDVLI